MNSTKSAGKRKRKCTTEPREFFKELLSQLSPEAQKCDIGFFITHRISGACVNNFHEGRISTIKERLDWLRGKMTERRGGRYESTTLAKQFPSDWEIIRNARP